MTISELIQGYIERHYDVHADGGKITFYDKAANRHYGPSIFLTTLDKLFGEFHGDRSIFQIFVEWFEKHPVIYEGKLWTAGELYRDLGYGYHNLQQLYKSYKEDD